MKTIHFLSGLSLLNAAALLACSGAPSSDTGTLAQGLEAQHCGGNIANPPQCPDGFECVPDPANPFLFGDVGGICQAVSEQPPRDGHHHRRHHHHRRG